MADLREMLSGLGYAEVRTHLQSGNALFDSSEAEPGKLAGEIERGIRDALGLSVRCLVRSRDELHAVVEGNPLSEVASDGSKMVALFLSEAPDPELLVAHDPRDLAPDQIHFGDRVIYQWCPDGFLAAPAVGGFVEKHLKVAVTGRNWNTVTKLAELLDG
jgi:uncharacterized protein (DUF1697 family)